MLAGMQQIIIRATKQKQTNKTPPYILESNGIRTCERIYAFLILFGHCGRPFTYLTANVYLFISPASSKLVSTV